MTPFDTALDWLRAEREYQTEKFDYSTEGDRPTEYWSQQFASYTQRVALLGVDTPQGVQAVLKLAATAIACSEHAAARMGSLPRPGLSSGYIEEWDRIEH
jgi:hypothetical protein